LNRESTAVVIGDGTFIGVSSVILPNARLGKRCVIGANSVVTAGYYPDGSVLMGSPAQIIRKAKA
jgi:acetyltransferase-like isoleucine patch superfamily enzyme